MATINKRGPFQFQAQVRRKGYPHQTKTFESKREAEDWAAMVELEMRQRTFVDRSEAESTTFGEILERYLQEITPEKRGWRAESSRIRQFQRHPLALRVLSSLRSVDFSNYVKERKLAVGPKTICLELSVMSAVFNVAADEWSIPVTNPITSIRKPGLPQERKRRLMGDEEARLFKAAKDSRVPALAFCITLAIETGMRRGEIAELTWKQVDLHNRVIRLDMTKNGDGRTVPLTEAAEAAIRALPRPLHGGPVTTCHDSNGLGAAFRRVCHRAGITNLHFHDLRHEAASRLARKMEVATLAKVMGWRTLQMAMRYYNPTDDELVDAVRAAA